MSVSDTYTTLLRAHTRRVGSRSIHRTASATREAGGYPDVSRASPALAKIRVSTLGLGGESRGFGDLGAADSSRTAAFLIGPRVVYWLVQSA